MSKSDYLEAQLINHVLRGTAYSSPTAVYAALYTAAPTDAGGGTEVSGGSYVRQQVTFSTPSGGETSNTAEVIFPLATADWGTLVAVGIFDAVSAGNLLYWANLNASRTILTNDQFRFPASQLIVQED